MEPENHTMGLFNNLFGKDQVSALIQLGNFDAHYLLTVNNEFIMGRDNPPMALQSESNIFLQQQVGENSIQTTVGVNSITAKTESNLLKPHLQQMLMLAGISRTISFERNAHGKILGILNKDDLNKEWLAWKETILPKQFPDQKQQLKFAGNFEKGLKVMDKGISNNLNYFILLPEVYHIKKYNSDSNVTDPMSLPSKLVGGMPIEYRFKTEEVNDGDKPAIRLKSEILNIQDIRKKHLEHYYKEQTEFDITDYNFSIDLNYLLEKDTGKIVSGSLFLREKMHDHLQYIQQIRVTELAGNEKEQTSQQPVRKFRRSFFADDVNH